MPGNTSPQCEGGRVGVRSGWICLGLGESGGNDDCDQRVSRVGRSRVIEVVRSVAPLFFKAHFPATLSQPAPKRRVQPGERHTALVVQDQSIQRHTCFLASCSMQVPLLGDACQFHAGGFGGRRIARIGFAKSGLQSEL
jgi:hypothetical protein